MDLSFKELLTMNPMQARRRLLETYWKMTNISETARRWKNSRQLVRKWIRRYQQAPADGLRELSRRPKSSPRRVSARIEQSVLEARKITHYGRKRLALYLWRTQHLQLSPHTIRHILRRVRASTARNEPGKPSIQPIGPGNTQNPLASFRSMLRI